jgi:hypothetical protein
MNRISLADLAKNEPLEPAVPQAALPIVAIQHQRTISAEYQRLASVDDSIAGEPLLNAAGQTASAKH